MSAHRTGCFVCRRSCKLRWILSLWSHSQNRLHCPLIVPYFPKSIFVFFEDRYQTRISDFQLVSYWWWSRFQGLDQARSRPCFGFVPVSLMNSCTCSTWPCSAGDSLIWTSTLRSCWYAVATYLSTWSTLMLRLAPSLRCPACWKALHSLCDDLGWVLWRDR